ncbi:hypothetical protein ADUPG1_004282, partial [Aduncisulcus paluster]
DNPVFSDNAMHELPVHARVLLEFPFKGLSAHNGNSGPFHRFCYDTGSHAIKIVHFAKNSAPSQSEKGYFIAFSAIEGLFERAR